MLKPSCYYTNFVNTNGNLFVCGEDKHGYGVLGLGSQIKQVDKITQIKTKLKFMDICCGNNHTLGLDCNGKIWSWGWGLHGQLGHGDTNNRYIPTQIKYFKYKNIKIIQISCGRGHNLLLSNMNKV